VEAAFERYKVGLLYADPQKIEHLTDRWTGRWGKDRVADFVTNLRSRKLGDAVGCYLAAVAGGDMTHDGDSVFARHMANARRKVLPALDDDGRNLFTLTKDRPHSPNKIDAAMAGSSPLKPAGTASRRGCSTPAARVLVCGDLMLLKAMMSNDYHPHFRASVLIG
jgi:hypothetical protein